MLESALPQSLGSHPLLSDFVTVPLSEKGRRTSTGFFSLGWKMKILR